MKLALIHNWWSLVLRGSIGVLLGIATFVWPQFTLAGLVTLFGIYAFIDGFISIAGAVRASREHVRWGALVVEGIIGIAAGIIAFFWPAITIISLVYIIGAWALITGIFEIAAAIRLRSHITGEWLLALAGIASIVFGLMLMFVPLAGAIVLAFWFGAYALVFGITLIALGVRLRALRHRPLAGPGVTTAHAH